ncbi:uncharacterized protein LOC135844403 isoform X2 [Planococcus citri]|uniref:uncharacterized protein LOC135844403 isoform X2 n=1 Tax=Planococcus citri TaxID=170843 RepID=UPI0031F8A49F
MSRGQPSKKIRLDREIATTSRNQKNDDELWGDDDLCLDDDVMQQIESQALSQFQMSRPIQTQNFSAHPQRTNNYEELEQKLQTKQGEVTNLRMENSRITKEFKNQLDAKNELIENLNKQLRGKQTELEFQKAEMKSQICRTPRSSKVQQKVSNVSFHERFQFTQGKGLVKDGKVFNFGGHLNKGDILFKLVPRAFNVNEVNLSLQIDRGNSFALFLNYCLLKLCGFTSFDKPSAKELIALVMSKSREELSTFLRELVVSDEKDIHKFSSRNSRVFVLSKTRKDCDVKTCLLLTNAKWFSEETAVAVRQTIAMLAKLIQVEESLLSRMAVRVNRSYDSRDSEQTEYISDLIELLDKIVGEIALQKKSNQFEGVYSSILYFSYIFCARHSSNILGDRHITHLANILKKILFSLPGFVAVRYIVNFLNSSARFGVSDQLCHRSAADTFSENFTSFSFSQDTCALQVLCAHIEIIEKSPYFINVFTTWLVKMTTACSRRIRWMENQTDPKLCECLPTLEQITIRIMLHCVEWSEDRNLTSTEKLLLNSSIKRCPRIFKQFKWQDDQFHIHIANCSIEYEMLLFHLLQIVKDDATKTFFTEEAELLRSDNKFQPHSITNIRNHINSVLGFSPIIELESY